MIPKVILRRFPPLELALRRMLPVKTAKITYHVRIATIFGSREADRKGVSLLAVVIKPEILTHSLEELRDPLLVLSS